MTRIRKELELYFHIPFCVRKCAYCDFLSAPATETVQEAYMKALLAQTKGCADEYQDYRVSSVFIGGGTPTLVQPERIADLMAVVREHYDVSSDAEVTIECNPGTLSREKLGIYREAGINRLSIGLQSADNRELKLLGRIHTYEEFLESYKYAAEAGFTNINVDVMSALPGQSLASYEETLQKVLSLQPAPPHISAYSLIVEEETPFFEMNERGELALPDEDCERRMYERTEEMLSEHGYHRYEISNYAKEGFECRHNCGYWRRTEYVGFGIGAASLVGNRRFSVTSDLHSYLECFGLEGVLEKPGLFCEEKEEFCEEKEESCEKRKLFCEEQILSRREQMEEFMFLGLRMTEGVSCVEFQKEFGEDIYEVYGEVIEKNIQRGLLKVCKKIGKKEDDVAAVKEESWLALTKCGVDVSNQVMADFLM